MHEARLDQVVDQFITEQLPSTVELIEKLVNIDSFSHDPTGTTRVQDVLSRELARLGFSIEKREIVGGGFHVLARLSGKLEKTVLLLGHVDTPHPPGTAAQRPFSVRDGKATGPGASDMKAGLATAVLALEAVLTSGWKRRPTLEILLTPDEEIGSPNSRSIIEERARQAAVVLNLEPGRPDGSVVVARRGSAHLEIAVKGRAAHSGARFEDGRSAIVELSHKVLALHELNDAYPGATVNIGVIEGGTNTNVIAARARAKVHVGFWEIEEAKSIINVMRTILSHNYVEDTQSTLIGGISFVPMVETDGVRNVYRIFERAARDIGEFLPSTHAHGAADAGFPASLGIPTLCGIGPTGGNWHAEDEFLDVESIPSRARVLARSLIYMSEEWSKE